MTKTTSFERGVVTISIDTEQIWGYRDMFTEAQFQARYINTQEMHPKLLACLSMAQVRATWFVVGGLALKDSAGTGDRRMCGLLGGSIRVPANTEASASLWYCPSFLHRLRDSWPEQEIGLHGGLTHLVWGDGRTSREMAEREIREGIAALDGLCKRPCSFSYPRSLEAYHDLLPQNGLRCFRGRPAGMAWKLGRGMPGAVLRVMDEVRRGTPPVAWPHEMLPGFWSIPASMFLYPIGAARARVIGLGSRLERFRRGLYAAARHRGIFHFCLHPENLSESPQGIPLLEEILDALIRARDLGDVEVMTMGDVVNHMEKEPSYVRPKHQQHSDLFEAHRRS